MNKKPISIGILFLVGATTVFSLGIVFFGYLVTRNPLHAWDITLIMIPSVVIGYISVFYLLHKRVVEKSKQLEDQAKEIEDEKRKDEAILSSIGEGLIAVDELGRILKINGAACYLLNINDADVIGQRTSDVFQVYTLEGLHIPIEERSVEIALRTHVKTVREVIFKPNDKEKIILKQISTPIVENDKIIGAIEIIINTTVEWKIDRMKTEFISLASHQLRTPLSAIRWFAEMLLN